MLRHAGGNKMTFQSNANSSSTESPHSILNQFKDVWGGGLVHAQLLCRYKFNKFEHVGTRELGPFIETDRHTHTHD